MNQSAQFLSGVLLLSLVAGNFTLVDLQDNEKLKTIRRAKRPALMKDDWKKIYFDDLFEEGLVGPRPEKEQSSTSDGVSSNSNSSGWSKVVSRDVLESEVKALHRKLQPLGTTPSRFNTQFAEMRQHFSMLSTIFGIIHEYDSDVRWKKSAGAAQAAFAEASNKARIASKTAFQNSKLRKEDLAELIRGGGLSDSLEVPSRLEWSKVVSRNELMTRLDEAIADVIKPAIANEAEFQKRADDLAQQASVVAAVARVLVQEGMDDADDEGYAAFSDAMQTCSTRLISAIEANDFELAAQSVNKIEQSCSNCHGEWR